MTICAGKPLPGTVLRMAESEAKCTRVGSGSRIRFLLVTNSARSNLFARLRFAARCVAGVTLIVCRHPTGNALCECASARPAMTCRAATGRPRRARHMLSVIKSRVEAFVKLRGKTPERRVCGIHVRVADDAHRDIG